MSNALLSSASQPKRLRRITNLVSSLFCTMWKCFIYLSWKLFLSQPKFDQRINPSSAMFDDLSSLSDMWQMCLSLSIYLRYPFGIRIRRCWGLVKELIYFPSSQLLKMDKEQLSTLLVYVYVNVPASVWIQISVRVCVCVRRWTNFHKPVSSFPGNIKRGSWEGANEREIRGILNSQPWNLEIKKKYSWCTPLYPFEF